MNHYFWQIGLIGIIVGALIATNQTQTRHAQIVVPALTGDSVIVRTTGDRVILIDTGNDAPKLLEFIGTYRRSIHTSVVDTVIITQSGVAWQGALPALVMRGVRHIIWLPVSHTDGHNFCTQYAITCVFATDHDAWQIDDITIQTAGQRSLWVIWPTGQLLIAHSGPESNEVPMNQGLTGVIYPWRIEPALEFQKRAKVAFVLYSDGMHPHRSARKSMAQRHVGSERLLHEQIDGDIYISLTNPPYLERIPAP